MAEPARSTPIAAHQADRRTDRPEPHEPHEPTDAPERSDPAELRDPPTPADGALWLWRHPRAQQAQGRCIGRTNLAVSPRRAKRLAHRIRQAARRAGLPRCVLTSPLARCRAVGRQLQRWGWQHRIDPALREMDFGQWDGQPWRAISQAAVDAWCADFLHHRPGGGESLHGLFCRVAAWQPPAEPALVVGHGGWMLARQWLATGRPWPRQAADWPAPPAHGQCWRLPTRLSTALPPPAGSPDEGAHARPTTEAPA